MKSLILLKNTVFSVHHRGQREIFVGLGDAHDVCVGERVFLTDPTGVMSCTVVVREIRALSEKKHPNTKQLLIDLADDFQQASQQGSQQQQQQQQKNQQQVQP
ncbi:hypothetical protein [Ostreibacterium oceani]|uniref:Uncharacterized protein n=1 Tax=Ostreibacterium oceani TaxID=2654998 RepID=A0A6N7EWG4_9GAMM|nr:hypothetical protein [Ostreibacterium oceani]MPV86891.1 hypothetical protein [Ostreibacterium oceani]